jgi:hypothetical protein
VANVSCSAPSLNAVFSVRLPRALTPHRQHPRRIDESHPRQETAVATRAQPVVMSPCRGSRTWSRVRRSLFTRFRLEHLRQETAVATRAQPVVMSRSCGPRTWSRSRVRAFRNRNQADWRGRVDTASSTSHRYKTQCFSRNTTGRRETSALLLPREPREAKPFTRIRVARVQ